jgi:two-component system, cell cycle response regulator
MRYDEEETTEECVVPPAPLPGRDDASVLVLSGPLAGQFYKIPRNGGVIGRDPDVEIRLLDPGISRRHAEILRTEDGHYILKDLESRYGVYVEGAKITEKRVSDGDRLQLSGETVLRLRYQDPKETEIIEKIQDAATRDALTSVSNRRYFVERLEQEFAFARRHRTSLGVMMIDVDHFKRVNDEHGHAVGDEVLRTVGRTLHDAVRTEDLVARYGGDEFIVLSRGAGPEDIARFAERLRTTMREKVIRSHGEEFLLTLSIGLACFENNDPSTMMELIARADSGLYAAKRQGRDRVAAWSLPEPGK